MDITPGKNQQMVSDRRLGYAIISCILLIAAILIIYASYNVNNNGIIKVVSFYKIGNLKIDDQVRIKGISAGKIHDIKWRKNDILVFMALQKPVTFHKGYTINNNDVGLMGDRMLSIETGNTKDPVIPDKDTLKGIFNTGLSEAVGMGWQICGIADSLKNLSNEMIKSSPGHPSISEKLENIISSTDSISARLSEAVSLIEKNMPGTLDTIQETFQRIDDFSSKAGNNVPKYISDIKSMSLFLENTLDKLDTLSGKASRLANLINNPQGDFRDSSEIASIGSKMSALRDLMNEIRSGVIKLKLKI
jgi:ABC-type transporter Mla subunit MlaD